MNSKDLKEIGYLRRREAGNMFCKELGDYEVHLRYHKKGSFIMMLVKPFVNWRGKNSSHHTMWFVAKDPDYILRDQNEYTSVTLAEKVRTEFKLEILRFMVRFGYSVENILEATGFSAHEVALHISEGEASC